MTQRKRIAWTYLIAVPVVLIIVLVQSGALVRAMGRQNGLVQAASTLDECDAISRSLEELESTTGRYIATGSAGYSEQYRAGAAQFQGLLQTLQESTKNDTTGPRAQLLAELVKSQMDAWQESMDARKSGRTDLRNERWAADIDKTIADIKHGQQARIQREKDAALQSLHTTNNLIRFSGAVVVWIVMVAAFLLFHDEKARDWTGIERRVHSRILQTLPLSVCLSSESGLIVYVNQVAEEVFGYRSGELLARDGTASGEDKGEGPGPKLRHIFDRLTSGEVWAGHLRMQRADGAVVKTASWIKNIEVGETHCQLVVHCTVEGGTFAPRDQVETAHV